MVYSVNLDKKRIFALLILKLSRPFCRHEALKRDFLWL